MSFLTDKYKGTYRIMCPYDLLHNSFPRKLNGNFEDIDQYIDCQKGIKIFYYGKSILQCYIPSLQRGHNKVKAIKSEVGDDIIFDIEETDSEVLFKFKASNMDKLEPYLNPKTSGADRSPYSTKNLPKTKYQMSESDLLIYKAITAHVKKNEILKISHITKDFLKTLCNKRYTEDKLKENMRMMGLSGKDYIHSIGKWNEFTKYLKERLEEELNVE